MFKSSTIASNVCVTTWDHGLSDSFKYTWIFFISAAARTIQPNPFWNPRLLRTQHFLMHSKEKKCMLLKLGKRSGQEIGHLVQTIGDQTSDTNVHKHICRNGKVSHHAETTSDIWHVFAQGHISLVGALAKRWDNLQMLLVTSKARLRDRQPYQPKHALKNDVGQHVVSCHRDSRHPINKYCDGWTWTHHLVWNTPHS